MCCPSRNYGINYFFYRQKVEQIMLFRQLKMKPSSNNVIRKKERKQGNTTTPIEQVAKQITTLAGSVPLVLSYIPKSYRRRVNHPLASA